ncbi:MAG: transglutaminase domain-containing protein, partial [Prolixibacteraceae bacterium]
MSRTLFQFTQINVSYQFFKLRFFALFLVFALIIVTDSCQSDQHNKNLLTRANNYQQSGQFAKLSTLADSVFKLGTVTQTERVKIDSLKEISQRILIDFSLTESDINSKLLKYFPQYDSDMISRWEKNGKLEMRWINGEKRYFKNAVRNLFLLDDSAHIRKVKVDGFQADSLDIFRIRHTKEIIDATKTLGETVLPIAMKLTYSIRVKPNAVPDGEIIRCWMPFPRGGNVRQKNIRLLSSDPENAVVAPESDLQRSVYLEKKAVKDQPTTFQIEFEVETSAQYFDLKPEEIKPYNTESDIYKKFTSERAPQILFSEKIRNLGNKIVDGETNPLKKVQKIYNWINDSIRWASALEYSTMPDIPEYVLKNRHGDCGMQTLLFMTLARSQGIPVKWQSGWKLHPNEVNLHDWCEVYYEGVGWVPLDQSFGLQSSKDEKVRNFYRSGIDSYRLIVNDDYAGKL